MRTTHRLVSCLVSFMVYCTALLGLAACGSEATDSASAPAGPAPEAAPATIDAPAPNPAPVAELAVGSPAPGFALAGSDGNTHRLSDYAGQHVVVAFFPKAFTGG